MKDAKQPARRCLPPPFPVLSHPTPPNLRVPGGGGGDSSPCLGKADLQPWHPGLAAADRELWGLRMKGTTETLAVI